MNKLENNTATNNNREEITDRAYWKVIYICAFMMVLRYMHLEK